MKGKLITLYGVNNMGKSTHSLRLVEKLRSQGHDVEYVKYPVYDIEPSGPFLNGVLRGDRQEISEEELQMWFIVNRHQFQPQLKAWLGAGKIVVAEDYVGTGIAWGMTKGLDERWLEVCNESLIKEDVVILIEGERSMDVVEEHHVHEQDNALVARCYETFQYLAKKHGWHKVRLQDEKDDTAALIWNVVEGEV